MAGVRFFWLATALLSSLAALPAQAETVLRVDRFFDPCIEDSTSLEQASGEACIVQAMLNAFSAEDNGITVDLLPPHRDNYYDQLKASYQTGDPPDLHLLHRHRLRHFAEAGLLAPLGGDLAKAGIDFSDWEAGALEAVTLDDKIVAVPFDLHANLWHINLTLLTEAGLVGADGRPILPSSPGELLEHARLVREKTGKAYLAADFTQFPIGVRAVLSLLWQQNRNIVEGDRVTIDTPEMRAAITSFTDLFDQGLADPTDDYEAAQQAFLNGEVAVLINGTWAVDLYDKEVSRGAIVLTDYDVTPFPVLFDRAATWADLHLWAVPAIVQKERPEIYQAVLKLLAWINDHNFDWARTGHLAIRSSVLESDAYATLAHRLDYRNSAAMASDIPATAHYEAVQEVLAESLQSIWVDGRPIDQALADAEAAIQGLF